ncbi:hypothetical protein RQP46_008352 [Phenoliferia psychrophenolica]
MFLFGSAMCGAAKSMTWLCALRGIQGIGGGGILQVTQIVISDIVPLHRRGAYSGGIGATWGIAAVLGPLCGGLLTEYVSWRWCFFINLPTGGFALALLVFSLKLNPHKGMTFADFKRTFDFFGLFLIIAGVVCVLIGFSSGQTAWKTPETIVLLTFISSSYYLPLYFQILGASATLSGVAMLPLSVGSAIVSIGSGFLLAKTQQYRGIIIASFFFCVLSFSLIATLDESSSRAKQEIYLLLAAFGTGALFQTPLVALQAAVPISDMATATASLGLVRQLAGTTSISIGGAIYSSELKRRLRTVSGYTASRSALAGNVIELNKIEPLALREEVLHAFTRSINTVYYGAAQTLTPATITSRAVHRYGPPMSPSLSPLSSPSPRNRHSSSISEMPARTNSHTSSAGSFSSPPSAYILIDSEDDRKTKRIISTNSLAFGAQRKGHASLGAFLRAKWRSGRTRWIIGITLILIGGFWFASFGAGHELNSAGTAGGATVGRDDALEPGDDPGAATDPTRRPEHRPVVHAAEVAIVDVDVWPAATAQAAPPAAEERFLAYTPHSGYHNQRISLENALSLAFILGRTLLLPPVWLGHAIPWIQFDKLQARLEVATKTGLERCKEFGEGGSEDIIPRECTGYFDWTLVHWDFLVDLAEARKLVPTRDRWNHTEAWLNEELGLRPSPPGSKRIAASPDTFYLREKTMYQYRMYDSPEDDEPLAKFENRIDLSQLAADSASFKLLHLGSLFGTSRLHVQEEANFNARSAFRNSMVFRNPLIDEITYEIRDRLGGPASYYGLHLRVGDGIFQKSAPDNMAGVWLLLCATKMKVDQDVCDEVAASSAKKNGAHPESAGTNARRAVESTTKPKLGKRGNSRPQREGAFHHAQLPQIPPIHTREDSPLDSTLSCRGALHTSPKLLPFNAPLFIATDSKVPTADRNLAIFFDAFPCTFIVSDFASTSPLNSKVIAGLARLPGLRNSLDKVPLAQFLWPQLDAQIAAYGRALVGTPQSTYSRFAVDVLHQVYHGYLGVEVALTFIEAGHRVRGTVRTQAQADAFLAAYPHLKSSLEFIVVPVFDKDGAFDEAVKGVDYIAHTASPVPAGVITDNEAQLLIPAIRGTLGMLESALREPTVKAVVLTSSFAAVRNFANPALNAPVLTSASWNPISYETAKAATPAQVMLAYSGSKVLSEKAAWEFMEREKPHFTLTTILPTWILGASHEPGLKRIGDLRSSPGMTAQSILDVPEIPLTSSALTTFKKYVHIKDVARAHVGAVTRPETQGQRYLLMGGPASCERAAFLLRKLFPEHASRIARADDKPIEMPFDADGTPAERAFGFKYLGLEETLKDWGQQVFALER